MSLDSGSLLPGGTPPRRRNKLHYALEWGAITPLASRLVLFFSALFITLGINFPSPTDLPCGATNGGWQDVATLDVFDSKAVDRRHRTIVHITGSLMPVNLNDEEFQFLRSGVALRRSVEMFQWVPDEGAKDGFSRRWVSEVIDSKAFPQGKLNPRVIPFSNHTQYSLPIRLQGDGLVRVDHSLSPLLLPAYYTRQPVVEDDLARLPSDLKGTFRVAEGYFFRGRDIEYPSVGDIRVAFYMVPPIEVSMIARLRGRTLHTCYVERGAAGKMTKPITGRWSERAAASTGRGGQQAQSTKNKYGPSTSQRRVRKNTILGRLGAVADFFRQESEKAGNSASGDNEANEEAYGADAGVSVPLALGAFLMPGQLSAAEMEKGVRERMEESGVTVEVRAQGLMGLLRWLWTHVLVPSWMAVAGWCLGVLWAVMQMPLFFSR